MGIQPFKKEKLQTRVADLYRQGLTYREIGEQLGISHENARQIYINLPVDKLLTGIDKGTTLESKEAGAS